MTLFRHSLHHFFKASLGPDPANNPKVGMGIRKTAELGPRPLGWAKKERLRRDENPDLEAKIHRGRLAMNLWNEMVSLKGPEDSQRPASAAKESTPDLPPAASACLRPFLFASLVLL